MTKNFTLDDFKFPGITGLEHNSKFFGFGTDTNASLTFNEFSDNSALPFTKQYGEEVTTDIEIEKIDYDVKLLLSAGKTITLPTSGIKDGRQVIVIPRFISADHEDETENGIVKAGSDVWYIEEHTDLTLIWNGYSWKEPNYALRTKVNSLITSCYTGRDLRKVLFDLGEIPAEHYTEITCAQVMDALASKCERNDFTGLGLGDWVDHDSIIVPTANVSDPGNSMQYTWGMSTGGYIGISSAGGSTEFNLVKNETYKNTRLRISGFDTYYLFGDVSTDKHHILFEYENIPFKGQINKEGSIIGGYPSSCLKQWLETSYYEALNASLNNHILKIRRPYLTSKTSYEGEFGEYSIFVPTVAEIAGYPAGTYSEAWGNSLPQWAIYNVNPNKRNKRFNNARFWWWLGDISASTDLHFVNSDSNGTFGHQIVNYADDGTSTSGGVSPAFCIA